MMLNTVSKVRSTPAAEASMGASTRVRFAAGAKVAAVASLIFAMKKTHTMSPTDTRAIKTTRDMNQRFVTARCLLIASGSGILGGCGARTDTVDTLMLINLLLYRRRLNVNTIQCP